jgi:large subunit ribosomal protein L19
MNAIDKIEQGQLKELPSFKAGDSVKVHVKIKEGDKERVQIFEGVVIKIKNGGSRASFTVRKISYGVGVERIFPMHSPIIDKIEVIKIGKVRRAKLYYLRELKGKKARIAAVENFDRSKKESKAKTEEKVETKAEKAPKKDEAKEA